MTSVAPPLSIVRGDPASCLSWLEPKNFTGRFLVASSVIFIGCALYGGAIGSWRDPLMGVFVAIKLPLLIFLTLLVNGMINGMLAAVVGSGLGFRESVQSQLMSFMILAFMLGSLSPIAYGMAWNSPDPESAASQQAHDVQLLGHVLLIAYAGIVSNYKLYRMLRVRTGSSSLAGRTLFCWLLGNLFVAAPRTAR